MQVSNHSIESNRLATVFKNCALICQSPFFICVEIKFLNLLSIYVYCLSFDLIRNVFHFSSRTFTRTNCSAQVSAFFF